MKIPLGLNYFDSRQNKKTSVVLDTPKLVNGHVLLLGGSGMGKSHTLKSMIRKGLEDSPGMRFHVFDVHGDLEIEGASTVSFSEQAPFGLNPLKVNPDVEFGGVRKCIQSFISTLDVASRSKMGLKQEAVLRSLLEDVFAEFGFNKDDSSSWSVNELSTRLISGGKDNRLYLEVPIADKDKVKAFGARWDPDKKYWWIPTHMYRGDICKWSPAHKERAYPSIKDVAAYTKSLYTERFLGSDQVGVRALLELNKQARKTQKKMLDSLKRKIISEYDEDTEAELDDAKNKCLEAYEHFINAIRTGQELDSVMKYQSPDILSSVYDRLENLLASGIFKTITPPFDESVAVHRYKLNALRMEEKKMFVLFTLQDIFYRAIQRGQQSDVVEVIVLDELGTYTSSSDEKGDGIIGTIAREARKFGVGLWAANQSLDGVPESLITSVGTKIILGLDESYWNSAVSKLRMDQKLLEWISPHHTMAVQLKEKGSAKNRWWWTLLE